MLISARKFDLKKSETMLRNVSIFMTSSVFINNQAQVMHSQRTSQNSKLYQLRCLFKYISLFSKNLCFVPIIKRTDNNYRVALIFIISHLLMHTPERCVEAEIWSRYVAGRFQSAGGYSKVFCRRYHRF